MKYEDYAEYEAERVKGLRERGAGQHLGARRRAELMQQLLDVLDAIEGRVSAELVSELREELTRLG